MSNKLAASCCSPAQPPRDRDEESSRLVLRSFSFSSTQVAKSTRRASSCRSPRGSDSEDGT